MNNTGKKDDQYQSHRYPKQEYNWVDWDEKTAEWYVRNWGDHPTNRMTVELAQLEPNDIIIDIGCGSGTAVRESAPRVPSGRVIGVDPTTTMIQFSIELSTSHPQRDRIHFLEGVAEHLPLLDASATVALAINSLHHWENPEAALVEILRILKPAGRLLVTDEEAGKEHWGHGDNPLSDAVFLASMMTKTGFANVNIHRRVEAEVTMLALTARAPTH